MIDMQHHQARITLAQMHVADALDAIGDEETREQIRAAVRELTAAWRSLLSAYASDAAELIERATDHA